MEIFLQRQLAVNYGERKPAKHKIQTFMKRFKIMKIVDASEMTAKLWKRISEKARLKRF